MPDRANEVLRRPGMPTADTEKGQAARRVVLACHGVAIGDSDAAVSCLNEHGFFLAGLVLHGPDGHDHLRLQRLNCENVELKAIVCDSPTSERLKQHVLEDRVRVERSSS